MITLKESTKIAIEKVLHDKGKSKRAVMLEFERQKIRDYPVEDELFQRLHKIVHEYDGQISLASALGVVTLLADQLIIEGKA